MIVNTCKIGFLCNTPTVAYSTSNSPLRCPASPYSSTQRYYAPDKEQHPKEDASKCATQDQYIDTIVSAGVLCRHNLA
jgi:hypothetical protein